MSAENLEILQIIQKKLKGKRLSYQEYYKVVKAIAENRLSDILLTYFVASTYEHPPSLKELYFFTKAMVETGIKLKFSPPVVDKHSTGGVPGNRITLILVPIIASLGITIPKTSSRAITSPAGTADCMEVLAPVSLSPKKIYEVIKKTNGCIIWGGNLNIAPADDELIRVEKPLQLEAEDKVIVSIMAKKIAVSATHLVLDIPYSSSLKIKNKKQAEKIARKFRALAKMFSIKLKIILDLSDDNLSNTAGPALESYSALKVLEQKEDKSERLEEKAVFFSAHLYALAKDIDFKTAKKQVWDSLRTLKALNKFKEIIKAQGGDPDITSEKLMNKIRKKTYQKIIYAKKSGKIRKMSNSNLSAIAQILGAPHYKYAGVYMFASTGDIVKKGDALYEFFSQDKHSLQEAEETLKLFPIYTIR